MKEKIQREKKILPVFLIIILNIYFVSKLQSNTHTIHINKKLQRRPPFYIHFFLIKNVYIKTINYK